MGEGPQLLTSLALILGGEGGDVDVDIVFAVLLGLVLDLDETAVVHVVYLGRYI